MRVFVFDPGLEGRFGHHDHMAEGLLRELRAAEIEARIYGNVRARPELLAAVPLTPLFRQSHYELNSRDPYDGMLVDLLAGARLFHDDLAALDNESPGDDDLVFLPTAGLRELMGLALWMKARAPRPRVAALFHRLFSPGTDAPPGSLAGALHRQVGSSLGPLLAQSPWLIAATNSRLAGLMSGPLGIKVAVFPAPIWYAAASAATGATAAAPEPPVIAFLGDMRAEKGYKVVPPLIRAAHSGGLPARFLVHLGVARDIRDLGPYHALQQEGLAEVVTGWVPDDRMQAMIESAALIALPFDRVRYHSGVSGVFCLAAANARPCVAPSGTWMADQIEAGDAAGLCYPEGGVEVIVETLARALGRIRELRASAAELAPLWRERQSGSALVARLLAWAHQPGNTPSH